MDVILDWLNENVKPWLVNAWDWIMANPWIWAILLAILILIFIGAIKRR